MISFGSTKDFQKGVKNFWDNMIGRGAITPTRRIMNALINKNPLILGLGLVIRSTILATHFTFWQATEFFRDVANNIAKFNGADKDYDIAEKWRIRVEEKYKFNLNGYTPEIIDKILVNQRLKETDFVTANRYKHVPEGGIEQGVSRLIAVKTENAPLEKEAKRLLAKTTLANPELRQQILQEGAYKEALNLSQAILLGAR